jgi:hypothetical protein
LLRVKWIDQAYISEFMAREIGAPIVDIRRVPNIKAVAAYVAKYTAKQPEGFAGTKRYWRSQDWLIEGIEPDADPSERIGWTFLVIRKHYYDVRFDQSSTGITFAETIQGQAVRIGWWTGCLR